MKIEGLLSHRARTVGSSVIRDLLELLDQPGVLSLAGGLPAADAIPVDRLRIAVDRALSTSGTYGSPALQYGPTEGVGGLRDALAAEAFGRDRRTVAADVLVTTGSQQAIDLLARVLLDHGDVAVIEAPGYLGTIQTMVGAGAQLVAVPIDDDGLQTDVLEHRLRAGLRPKLCSVVPNFQNPSGATLSDERRVHLGALAEHYGFVVIEDDPYRALRFSGDDSLPIRTHTELAVSLGSVSKVLAPGLRVGWLAAPPALLGPLVRAKQSTDLHTSTLAQYAVLDVLRDEAFLSAHIARLRALYATRCGALVTALRSTLGRRVEVSQPDGGFFLWARFPGVDTTAMLPTALDHQVAYVPGSAFTTDRFTTDHSCHDHARMSFASLDPVDLHEAARRVAGAVASMSPTPASV